MPVLLCPSCGGDVSFRSSYSVSAICAWCRSLLVRHDVDLEKLGSEADLPVDSSLLQLGARGVYQRVAFDIVGRIIVGWDEGRWNEWYVYFEDGRDGWLAEAQGEFAILFSVRDATLPARESLQLGQSVVIATVNGQGRRYEIVDLREVACVGAEGELPVMTAGGRAGLSVDLIDVDNSTLCAAIEYSDNEIRVFAGARVEFDSLHLEGLRELHGW